MTDDEEIIQAFLEESRENLDQLERDLVTLETQPGDPELLAQVYRTIHTIKGTCGFLGYHRLEALSHVGENLLDGLRSGAVTLDADTTSTLLTLVDTIRDVLLRIESTGQEGDDPHTVLIETLAAHAGMGPTEIAPAVGRAPTLPPAAVAAVETPAQPAAVGAPTLPPAIVAAVETPGSPAVVSVVVGAPGGGPSIVPSGWRPGAADTTVRVDVAMLDKLMDLVGELVLTRNRIGSFMADDGPLAVPFRQLRLVTADLQATVMEARLQPMGTVTSKFRRIARDLAVSLGKQVHVEVEGEDVGVDKAVNEALRDPLLHLVRNAVDHGLEEPVERIAAGKDPEGQLSIRTFHEGGLVHLEVSDDGRGIDGSALAAAAVREGFLTAEAAAHLDLDQTMALMFRAGVTTNDHVTTVSGRGVGLDVVRARIAEVGGSVEVTSEPGHGTRFRINVPLTLAIMTTVMVWSKGGRYAVPQVQIQEVVHLDPDGVAISVDDIGGASVLRRRGELIPLIGLAEQLGLSRTDVPGAEARSSGPVPSDGMNAVVVDINDRRFGIVVDAVGESIEAVVKPLTRATRSIGVFAGVTILGDGLPSLIIDLAGLARAAGIPTPADIKGSGGAVEEDDSGGEGEADSLLIAMDAGGGQLAIPLSAVVRLERFGPEQVEHIGRDEVIQYGGGVLPILRVAVLLGGSADDQLAPGGLQTIVCQSSVGPVGIVVDRIDDVVAIPATLFPPSSQLVYRRGVAACLIIEDRVTELLDIEALVADGGLHLSGAR